MKRLRDKEAQFQRLKDIAESKQGVLLSLKFETAKTKYDFKCNEGHEFGMTSDKVVGRGDWCPYCSGRYGDFQEKFRKIIEEDNGGTMLSDYVNYETLIKYECIDGHINYGDPRNLHAGKFCALCQRSHGEKAVEKYLIENSLAYQTEYTFDDLKGDRNVLPFDFAVLNESHELICLIEYDGEQHFRPMRHSESRERNVQKFEQTQRHDKLKNDYCERNHIPLIRISCFDIDYRRIRNLYHGVNKILDVELKNAIHANTVPSPN